MENLGTPKDLVRQARVEGDLDRESAEALMLEIRRLARRYGVEVKNVTVDTVIDE